MRPIRHDRRAPTADAVHKVLRKHVRRRCGERRGLAVRLGGDAADVHVERGHGRGARGAEEFVGAEARAELPQKGLRRAVGDDARDGQRGGERAAVDELGGPADAAEAREEGAGEEEGEERVAPDVGEEVFGGGSVDAMRLVRVRLG